LVSKMLLDAFKYELEEAFPDIIKGMQEYNECNMNIRLSGDKIALDNGGNEWAIWDLSDLVYDDVPECDCCARMLLDDIETLEREAERLRAIYGEYELGSGQCSSCIYYIKSRKEQNDA